MVRSTIAATWSSSDTSQVMPSALCAARPDRDSTTAVGWRSHQRPDTRPPSTSRATRPIVAVTPATQLGWTSRHSARPAPLCPGHRTATAVDTGGQRCGDGDALLATPSATLPAGHIRAQLPGVHATLGRAQYRLGDPSDIVWSTRTPAPCADLRAAYNQS